MPGSGVIDNMRKKVCLSVCLNTGAKKGKIESVVLVLPTFEHISKSVVNKLKLKRVQCFSYFLPFFCAEFVGCRAA